ncbi:MAG: putative glycosyltransferase [Gemmatimonadetes bacterium]|nr:putative glycosyltransferase [Gemmatimonadota bacterium]
MLLTLGVVGAALLALTWVVYPAAIILAGNVARWLRTPDVDVPDAALPTVTVVVATRDAPDLVGARVLDILASSYPAHLLDVIVAVDARAELIDPESLVLPARARAVRGDDPGGKCPTLNAGVRAATGAVVAFTDTHQRFDALAMRRMVSALITRGYGATSGRLLLPRDKESSLVRRYTQYELYIRDGEAQLHSAVGVSGSVFAMWRALWSPLPAGLILDDLFTPMRLVLAGHRIGFQRDAFAYEKRLVVPSQEYRRKVRTLTGNLQLCAWLPGVLVPIRNPIWLQFVCHKLLRLVTPYAVALVGVAVAGEIATHLGDRLPLGLGIAAVASVWGALSGDVVARRLRSLVIQAASLQAAVVTATGNAIRGRWDVW